MNRSFFSTPRIVIALTALVLVAASAAFYFSQRPGIPVTSVAPAAVAKPSVQKLDIGSGYTLEMTGNQGKIVAPAAVVKPALQKLDIGSGYTLEMTGSSGKIVQPVAVKVEAKTVTRTFDLGSGYTLQMTGATGKIVAPAAHPAASRPTTRLDLGSGSWLVDGKMVKEGTR